PQHLAEREVRADADNAPPAGPWECRRATPLTALPLVLELVRAGSRIDLIARRQPVGRGCAHAESRGLHAERLEDAFAEERLERPARGARDEHTEDVGRRVVHPLLTRLVHERQRSEPADPLVRRRRRLWLRRSLAETLLAHGLLDWIRVRRGRDDTVARAEGEQVAHRDRPVRRHGVAERPIEPL